MTQDEGITIDRSLSAPRENVWRMWTVPEELARWWWPARFKTQYSVDLREGGGYRYVTVLVPQMGVLDLSGRFQSVEPPKRLAYTWQWAGEDTISRVTVHFDEGAAGTELHIRHAGLPTPTDHENHVIGWNDCLDRLVACLREG